jgi:hypothetical protein
MPTMTKVPQFLADTKYVNPADAMHSAFQIAFQTELPAFVWGATQPEMIQDFQVGFTQGCLRSPRLCNQALFFFKHMHPSYPVGKD